MKLLHTYKNGNYTVSIFDDGTKIRKTKDDVFKASFPENIDLKITNRCNMNCPMCHEKSHANGKHSNIINEEFINTLTAGTELALGGGMVTSYPDLENLLVKLKDKGIIANMTLHQDELIEKQEFINDLINRQLIYGIGVSLHSCTSEVIDLLKQYKNVVIHTIAGITTLETYEKLSNNGLKILILGYKEFGRGIEFFDKHKQVIDNNISKLENNIIDLLPKFKVVSFDNLALKQLKIKDKVSTEVWDDFYMGDDGQHTMYIDAVERTFSLNSISTKRYELLNNIEDMFAKIKEENK